VARGSLLDVEIPFFLPVWRRYLVIAVAVCWGLFEISTGALFWGMIFVGMGSIVGWRFYTADWTTVAKDADDK
jgi:hypothetical protein|tara:strand:- start:584 stop:802 length:219 start_codon:yes stop_codon:yes gene_type:complete